MYHRCIHTYVKYTSSFPGKQVAEVSITYKTTSAEEPRWPFCASALPFLFLSFQFPFPSFPYLFLTYPFLSPSATVPYPSLSIPCYPYPCLTLPFPSSGATLPFSILSRGATVIKQQVPQLPLTPVLEPLLPVPGPRILLLVS